MLHLVWGWKEETLKTPFQLKKKKISQLNEFSRRLEQTAQPEQKTANNYRQYCKARQPEAQPNSTVWGREGRRLILKQVGKKNRGGRGGGSCSLVDWQTGSSHPGSKIEVETGGQHFFLGISWNPHFPLLTQVAPTQMIFLPLPCGLVLPSPFLLSILELS